MTAEKPRKKSLATSSEATRGSKHQLPDPPDPDNLPIDYLGSGWDSSKFPSSTPRSLRPQILRPQHHGHRRSVTP
ncbi:hypothetical protein AB0N65_10545 [Paenarthrobacter sp. NPDC089322]|uniref:hypothetical protein n=1 Tax=Paenarthrobacter sp. NPDC089322 TaxID=3155065 RepID=UPI00343E0D62